MDVTEPVESSAAPEPVAPVPLAPELAADAVGVPVGVEHAVVGWPWDSLRAEQEGRPGSFTDVMRHEYRWDDETFTRLEEAMRAACEALEGQNTIERWVGEGFWCWTAVIPELTEHPRFSHADPHYLRRCLARLRDLGSWFFNGSSPYGPHHVWEPFPRARG
jgi:hypothetical protein